MHRVALIALDDCWLGSLALPADVLTLAAQRCEGLGRTPLSLHLLGLEPRVSGHLGLEIGPLSPLAGREQQFDVVILPGLWNPEPAHMARYAPLYPWLRNQHQQGAIMLGLLSGQMLLAESGLLDGRRATVHSSLVQRFSERYPRVLLAPDETATRDGPLLCANGLDAVLELSCAVVERLCGREVAEFCSSYCLGNRHAVLSEALRLDEHNHHGDAQVARVQQWLESHFAEQFNLEDVAQRFAMSPRNLRRRFHQATGESPHRYLQRCRIAAARQLLNNTHRTVEEIAQSVGYTSATVFGRQFRRDVGATPNQFRRNGG